MKSGNNKFDQKEIKLRKSLQWYTNSFCRHRIGFLELMSTASSTLRWKGVRACPITLKQSWV